MHNEAKWMNAIRNVGNLIKKSWIYSRTNCKDLAVQDQDQD